MSNSNKPGQSAAELAADLLDVTWVSRHRGPYTNFLKRHRRQVKVLRKEGKAGLHQLASTLFDRISDERALRAAWRYLSVHGGQAPGPDHHVYDDLEGNLVWQACRVLRDEIRAGEYELGAETVRWIAKGPGRGKRPLVIQSILDRVVQRACVEILQPLLDPQFDARSFGFRPRPKRGSLGALALARRLAKKEQRYVWVAADVKDAFGSVPLNRLLDVTRKYLPDENLINFLGVVVGGAALPGLRQGGPLSPLLLNLYLHHLLDTKWRKMHPEIPLIRYADDILLLCRTRKEARHAYDDLKELLQPTGLVLKESQDEAVRRLEHGEKVNYMGFKIALRSDGLHFALTDAAWDSLEESFQLAQEESHAPIRAVLALAGWISAHGPCYPSMNFEAAAARIMAAARRQGFDEIPGPKHLQRVWQRAYARWRKR